MLCHSTACVRCPPAPAGMAAAHVHAMPCAAQVQPRLLSPQVRRFQRLTAPLSCAPPMVVNSTQTMPTHVIPFAHPGGVPVNVRFNCPVAGSAPVPDCSICLGTGEPGVAQVLSCGHTFCRSCISQYAQTQARDNRIARCPECQRQLNEDDLAVCLPENAVDRLLAAVAAAQGEGDETEGQGDDHERARQAFERAARIAHLKCCPGCRAPIYKDGGCDHMTCRCGHTFNWSEAETLFPCNEVHAHPDIPLWGTTCPNSTLLARASLFARRAGLVTVGVTVVLPIVVCVGATVVVGWFVFTAGRILCTAVETLAKRCKKECKRQRKRVKRICC